MKKFLIMIGIWLVLAVSVVVGTSIYLANQGKPYEATAIPYLQQVIPVLSEWDTSKTRALLAPQSRDAIPEESVAQAMERFSRLGTLQTLETPEFDSLIVKEMNPETAGIYLTYTVKARYSNADAEFKIQLLADDNQYQIFNFNLSSDLLTE